LYKHFLCREVQQGESNAALPEKKAKAYNDSKAKAKKESKGVEKE
jgi:hypothetical protein